jgi:hypothetical protein
MQRRIICIAGANDDDDGHHGDPERPDHDRVRDRDLSGDRGALGLAVVIVYTVQKDIHLGCYSVIRCDDRQTDMFRDIVQTNIPTLRKALKACEIWQQREAEKDG